MTEQHKTDILKQISPFLQPRMLLLVWIGIGAIALAVVLISSSIPRNMFAEKEQGISNLLVGEMSDFTLTFPPRGKPYTQLTGPDGKTTLTDFDGKVILANFWATWCAPCVEELPSLDALAQRFRDTEFEVIAIAAEPNIEERGPAFFERLGITQLDIYADPQLDLLMDVTNETTLPLSIIYDTKGREVGRLAKPADWNSPEAIALIEAIISSN